MNANELADELEIAQGNNNADELIPKAIAMLRQQHKELEHMWMANTVLEVEIEALKAKTLTDEDLIEDLTHFVEKLHRRWGDDLWIDATDLMAIEKAIELLRKVQE